MGFLKQTTDKFLALGAFLLASIGICLSGGMVYVFVRSIWEEMSKAPSLNWESNAVIVVITIGLILMSLLIANIPSLIKYGIYKIKNETRKNI